MGRANFAPLSRYAATEPFRVLVADPPWRFKDALPGNGRGAVKHYPLMSLDEIASSPFPPLADDAYVFLWRVSSMVSEAYEVLRRWGCVPKTELVWLKRTKHGRRFFGMGRHLRGEHETCVVAVRGRPQPLSRSIRTTFEATIGRHSEKPDAFFRLVEEFAAGPYVELFARRTRPGWLCLGHPVPEKAVRSCRT